MENFLKKHLYLLLTIFATVIVVSWFILISNGDYGITMFFTIPISLGFALGYFKEFKDTSVKKILLFVLKFTLGLIILSVVLIVFGMEGAICIIMAIPFIAVAMFIGYAIGLLIGNLDRKRYLSSVFLVLLFVNPASFIFDQYVKPIQQTVSTEIVINSSQEEVWKLLSSKITFNQPEFLIFQKGVSYPKSIELAQKNGNPIYQCITNNDVLELNISEFSPNRKVKFSLAEQTVPMKEVSPYDEIDAKHLHDYFIVNFGEISLEKLGENKTKIIAKTDYSYKIAPKWYWKKWSNYILDKMQFQVLNSIKNQAEK